MARLTISNKLFNNILINKMVLSICHQWLCSNFDDVAFVVHFICSVKNVTPVILIILYV